MVGERIEGKERGRKGGPLALPWLNKVRKEEGNLEEGRRRKEQEAMREKNGSSSPKGKDHVPNFLSVEGEALTTLLRRIG